MIHGRIDRFGSVEPAATLVLTYLEPDPGQVPVAIVTGLTRVSDLAFTETGKLPILEQNTGGALAPPRTGGALLTATPDGTAPVTATDLHVPELVDPDGLAVRSNGAAYVASDSTGAHRGEIVKVTGGSAEKPDTSR